MDIVCYGLLLVAISFPAVYGQTACRDGGLMGKMEGKLDELLQNQQQLLEKLDSQQEQLVEIQQRLKKVN